MLFIGLDLAWSKKNKSGIAVIRGDRKKGVLESSGLVHSDSEIIDCIRSKAGDTPSFISIDAPLIVPNHSGRRPAEGLVGKLFNRYDAGAHPANRQRLSMWGGEVRGEAISGLLEKEGFEHNPYIIPFEKKRKFFEVYPHPSMVVLFGLERILRYKPKPKRDYQFRWREFERYQMHLNELSAADPPLIIPGGTFHEDVRKLKAGRLKDYEDTLDAIFCAYIAYFCWCRPRDCEVLGSMQEGYILTPVFGHMKRQLKDIGSQAKLQGFLHLNMQKKQQILQINQ